MPIQNITGYVTNPNRDPKVHDFKSVRPMFAFLQEGGRVEPREYRVKDVRPGDVARIHEIDLDTKDPTGNVLHQIVTEASPFHPLRFGPANTWKAAVAFGLNKREVYSPPEGAVAEFEVDYGQIMAYFRGRENLAIRRQSETTDRVNIGDIIGLWCKPGYEGDTKHEVGRRTNHKDLWLLEQWFGPNFVKVMENGLLIVGYDKQDRLALPERQSYIEEVIAAHEAELEA